MKRIVIVLEGGLVNHVCVEGTELEFVVVDHDDNADDPIVWSIPQVSHTDADAVAAAFVEAVAP